MSVDERQSRPPDADAILIDALCDDFERAWRNGDVPRIGDYVVRVDGGAATAAFAELLRVDCELRRRRGEEVSASEYLAQFPEFVDAICGLFAVSDVALASKAHDRAGSTAASSALRDAPGLEPADRQVVRVAVGGDDRTYALSSDGVPLQCTIDHTRTSTRSGTADALRPGPAAWTPGDSDRFRKIRSHAAGGMGQVWVALDTQIHREVALKVLKDERKHELALCDRFLAEGHITGALEHPGIVPVYALGIDAAQQAFYAMRFVRGESLRHAIKSFHAALHGEERLNRGNARFRELLRRIIDVCITVAYAHSRGVLHRDLKPDNVMLGKFGETYVVDWGMARASGSPPDGQHQASEVVIKPEPLDADSATRYGSAMGTPGFMSPEQAAGKLDELSPATDIYSIGAILYFLLTNKVSITAESLAEFLQKVEAGAFPPPQEVNPRAPKGLCAVCRRAMAQRPADRYSSARELAADMERWLADEPLGAMPDSLAQRTARFARRHYRWLVPLAAASVLTAIVAVVAAATNERARLRAEEAAAAEVRAKARAEANFLDARNAVDEWLTGFTESLAYYPGVADFRRRMLEQAAEQYEEFLEHAGNDPVVQLEAGRTYTRLGDLRRQLGASKGAMAAYGAAVRIFERLARDAAAAETSIDLARAHGRLALVHDEAGDTSEAKRLHEQALATATAGPGASDPEVRERVRRQRQAALGDLEINYAVFLARHGDMQESAARFDAVIRRLREAAQEDPGRIETRTALATALLGWGQVSSQLGDTTRARDAFGQAADYFDGAAQLADGAPHYVKLATDAKLFLAIAEGALGDQAAEAQAYREVIEAYDRLVAQLPDSPVFHQSRAMAQADLGLVLIALGEVESAQPVLSSAEATFALLLASAPSQPAYRESHATALQLLSTTAAIRGDDSKAVALARSALGEFESLATNWPDVPEYQERTASCESQLAQALVGNDEGEAADEHFLAAAARLDRALAIHPDDPSLRYAAAATLSRRGEAQALADDDVEAARIAAEADRHWERLLVLSSDAKYLAAAAWHDATFPIVDQRRAARAAEYAAKAALQSPLNKHYTVLGALAETQRGRAKESLASLAQIDVDNSNPFVGPLADYARCLAHAALGDMDAARRAFDAAVAATDGGQPGRWEFRVLRRRCESVLQPSADNDAVTSHAAEEAAEE